MALKGVADHYGAVVAALTAQILAQHSHHLESGAPIGVEDSEQSGYIEDLLSFTTQPTAGSVAILKTAHAIRETRAPVTAITRERRAQAKKRSR